MRIWLPEGMRLRVTQIGGGMCVLLSLWLAWRFFIASA